MTTTTPAASVAPRSDATEPGRLLRWSPLLAAAGCLVTTAVQLTQEYPAGEVHAIKDVPFLALLIGTALSYLLLHRLLGGTAWPSRVAVAGMSLIALGVVIGLVTGEDPEWFFVLAGPGLLCWLAGSVVLAMRVWRSTILSRVIAPVLALTMPLCVILSVAGGAVLPALMWLYVASVSLSRRQVHPDA